jgi:hypothetical protein
MTTCRKTPYRGSCVSERIGLPIFTHGADDAIPLTGVPQLRFGGMQGGPAVGDRLWVSYRPAAISCRGSDDYDQ